MAVCGSVCVLLRKGAENAIQCIKPVSLELMVKLERNPTTSLVIKYTPTSTSTEKAMENYYTHLVSL